MIRHLRSYEEQCFSIADQLLPRYAGALRKRARFFRYLASGGTAAATDLLLLYLLTDGVGFHYLFSAVLAFVAAFFVSFFLQKFWTFEDGAVEKVRAQAGLYLLVALGNLALNTLCIYIFVEWLHLWYMAAQFLASGLLAFATFFISRDIVFKKKEF